MLKSFVFATLMVVGLSGCATNDIINAVASSAGTFAQAASLDESDVQKSAKLAVIEMDGQANLAPASSRYSKRLNKIVSGLDTYDGIKLNFAVYNENEVNAFATPDGSVRVYSGLMDIMNDEQILAVIGHEITHIKFKHSYNQMRKAMVTRGMRQALASVDSSGLSSSSLGALGEAAVGAQFSQSDELEADAHAVTFLKERGANPMAMYEALKVLESLGGSSGGFLSSHPSSPERLQRIKDVIAGK